MIMRLNLMGGNWDMDDGLKLKRFLNDVFTLKLLLLLLQCLLRKYLKKLLVYIYIKCCCIPVLQFKKKLQFEYNKTVFFDE